MLSPEVHANALTAHPNPEAFPEAFALNNMNPKRVEAADKIREHTKTLLEGMASPSGVVRPADSLAAHAEAYHHVRQKYEASTLSAQSPELH